MDVNHRSENCQRQIPKQVKTIIEQEMSVETASDDDESENGGRASSTILSSVLPYFQKPPDRCKEVQPAPPRAQEKKIRIKLLSSSSLKSSSLSDVEVA